jgi:metallo-beta-lactamase class B
MRIGQVAVLVLVLTELFGVLSAARPAPIGAKSWAEPTEPFQIAGPIYYVGTLGICVYLITTPAGHILLSGGLPGTTPLLEASIRKLGFKPEDIRILLISHAHFDHVGTLAEMQKLTGAQVEVMEADVALLKSGGKIDYLFAKKDEYHFTGVNTKKVLRDGDTVTLGDVTLTAHLTPGHTPGCTTWTTTIRAAGHPYAVVFADGTGINPGTKFVKDPSYSGIADDYRKTFRVLESLHPDIFLAFHVERFDMATKHARAATAGVEAWVDPAGYREFVVRDNANFEKLIAEESEK